MSPSTYFPAKFRRRNPRECHLQHTFRRNFTPALPAARLLRRFRGILLDRRLGLPFSSSPRSSPLPPHPPPTSPPPQSSKATKTCCQISKSSSPNQTPLSNFPMRRLLSSSPPQLHHSNSRRSASLLRLQLLDYSSDRNILELKKNSVQIVVFPVVSGNFVPHKDGTLPPPSAASPLALIENSMRALILGFSLWDGKTKLDLVNELKSDSDFVVEEKLERSESSRRFSESKFCLFLHRGGEAAGMVEVMAAGCVPVVVMDRPVQDLPLMDVLR